MLSKKAKISGWFILIVIISGFVWWYFSDIQTAALIFFGYVAMRIMMNFFKKERQEYYE